MDWEYCQQILPKVSRTFALNIERLQGYTYKAVLLGYLFFRIADTFEDNIYQTETEKIKSLEEFAEIFKGNKSLSERLKLYQLLKFRWREDSADKNLMENGRKVLECYFELPAIYRSIMDPLVVITSEGMAKFQRRKLDNKTKIFQLKDLEDLEDYCYYVAGVVGVMLTEIFCLEDKLAGLKADLEKYQVKFGLALQFTNIIKDYKKDIARGWSYIPASITEKYRLKLNKIDKLSIAQQKGILKELAPRIIDYFDAALNYIKIIPSEAKSIRLFCIIPFVLAYNTLFYILEMKGNKLSRQQVAWILSESDSYAELNSLLEKDYLNFQKLISDKI